MPTSYAVASGTLLRVLQDREIALTEDDVQWAFDSRTTQDDAAKWVDEYLGEATLLSREEAELFRKISRKSIAQPSSSTAVPIIEDAEIQHALASLQASVLSIDEHCATLEWQKEELLSMIQANKPLPAVLRSQKEELKYQTDELGRLNISSEEMFLNAQHKLNGSLQALDLSGTSIKATAQEQISSDDRIISRVAKVLQALGSSTDASHDQSKVIRHLEMLVSLREAEWNDRIDEQCAFVQTATDHSKANEGSLEPLASEKEDLMRELTSLRADIRSVADMVVNNELGEPLTKTTQISGQSQASSQQAWAQYILSSLDFLQERATLSCSSIADVADFGLALDTTLPTLEQQRQQSVRTSAAIDRRASSLTFLKNASSSLPQMPETITSVMRHLEVDLKAAKGSDLHAKIDSVLQDKQTSARAQSISGQTNAAQGIGQLSDMRALELQGLLETLHANSKYGAINLEDRVDAARRERLAGEVSTIGQDMASVESDSTIRNYQAAETLIQRWSR